MDLTAPVAVTARMAFRALLFVVLYALAVAGAVWGLNAAHLLELRSISALIWVLAVITLAAFAAVYVHLVRANRLTPAQLGLTRPRWRLLHLLWQIPVMIIAAAGVSALVVTTLTDRTPDQAARSGDLLTDLPSLSAGLVVLVFVVVAVATPLWEELLFRGALLPGLARRFNPPVAVALSAAVFAAVHVQPLVLAYGFVLGLGLGWVRWFHRNLWAAVIAHAVNNALALTVVLLTDLI